MTKTSTVSPVATVLCSRPVRWDCLGYDADGELGNGTVGGLTDFGDGYYLPQSVSSR